MQGRGAAQPRMVPVRLCLTQGRGVALQIPAGLPR